MSGESTGPGDDKVLLDMQHPWPGLQAFDEENRTHFRGRSQETTDLVRRVRRKLLTLLFGVSGLGKTSLLQAGLAPALAASEFVPIIVRLDPGAAQLTLLSQVRDALAAAMQQAGIVSQPPPRESEDLWSFFHRRAGRWIDATGEPRLAVLIFDQFEELFTRTGHEEEAETSRRHFLTELAALVENNPSHEVRERMERQPELLEEYDFAQENYRVLISLREDFLPELEDLKEQMPSLMENRLRLTRLNEGQALEAILVPGQEVITEPVAREVVRFITSCATSDQGASLSRAPSETDPALLSLMCSELNAQRLAEKSALITEELVRKQNSLILESYYARCFEFLTREQRRLAQKVVEKGLLTRDGHRNSLAVTEAEQEFQEKLLPAETIPRLVRQRLLQYDERHGLRRIELTHDVLTAVVAKSRRLHEEEDQLEKKRSDELAELAQARLKEQDASVQLERARRQRRQFAVAGAITALLFLVALGFGLDALHQKQELAKESIELTKRDEDLVKKDKDLVESRDKATAALEVVEKVTDRFTGQLLDEVELSKGTQVLMLQRIVTNGLATYPELPPELAGAPSIKHNHSQLLRLSAEMAIAIDPDRNFDRARVQAEQAVQALMPLSGTDHLDLAKDLAQAYFTLGDLYLRHGAQLPASAAANPAFASAETYYRNAAQTAQALKRQWPDDPSAQLLVADALARNGDLIKVRSLWVRAVTNQEITVWRQLLADALSQYQQSFQLCSDLSTPKSLALDRQLRRMKAKLHNKMGTISGSIIEKTRSGEPDFITANNHFLKAREIFQQLVAEDSESLGDKQQLAYTINNIGWINLMMKRYGPVFENYNARLQISAGIAALDPHNYSYQHDLAEGYRHLGQVLLQAPIKEGGNVAKALENYQKAVEATNEKSELHLKALETAAELARRPDIVQKARQKLAQLKAENGASRTVEEQR